MESFANDLKHGLRRLRQSPGFALTAVATLALGIGANTAIFTVVNAVILRPLPYPDSDQIVNVGRPGRGGISEPLFAWWLRNNLGLADLAACHPGAAMSLNGGDRPDLAQVLIASQNYFRLFGARPIRGRTFTSAEDSPGGERVLVMSYGLWQRRFAADPSLLGKTVILGGAPYTVIGVLQPGFQPYPPADVWIPLQADPDSANQASVLSVAGRLPSGTTLASVNSRITAIDRRYWETHPRLLRIDSAIRATLLQQQIAGDIRTALLILQGAVGLVLLIACANVANLLLARATARQREIAIRAALGAGRSRIIRQLLTESLLLSFAGGAVGLAFGSWAVHALMGFLPADLPRLPEVTEIPALDPRVAAFTLLAAMFTGILFGLAPALHASARELTASLNESGSHTSSSRRQNRTRQILVAAEMALAVVLLCGALLLIRSFAAMHDGNLGFDPHNVLTLEVPLAGPGYSKASIVDRLARQLVQRIERIPGVDTAAVSSALPLWGRADMIFNIPGWTPSPGHPFTGDIQWRYVSPHYFAALRIPLVAGRFLRDQEPRQAVIISQTMARRYFTPTNPVGQSIIIGAGLGPGYQEGIAEIVGVVGDVRERLDIDPQPVMYQTPSQIPDGDMALLNSFERSGIVVRTRHDVPPMSVGQAVQQALAADQLPAARVQTMEQSGTASSARQNFNVLLLGWFAAIAVLLATVGIYGVMSYSVEQRTSEIGIRTALGATRSDTVRLVLLQALRMTALGVGVGIATSFGLTRLLSAQLYRVQPWDPLTFSVVPAILLLVGLAAACIPAMRAARIEPMTALRHE